MYLAIIDHRNVLGDGAVKVSLHSVEEDAIKRLLTYLRDEEERSEEEIQEAKIDFENGDEYQLLVNGHCGESCVVFYAMEISSFENCTPETSSPSF